jgi:hypothetical protein
MALTADHPQKRNAARRITDGVSKSTLGDNAAVTYYRCPNRAIAFLGHPAEPVITFHNIVGLKAFLHRRAAHG